MKLTNFLKVAIIDKSYVHNGLSRLVSFGPKPALQIPVNWVAKAD